MGQGQGDKGRGQEGVRVIVKGQQGVSLPVMGKVKVETGGKG